VRRLLLAAVLALLLASCSSDNYRDIEGVPSQNPEKVEVWNNVDGHPNLVTICIHGAAFITTTREHNAYSREESLDVTCPTQTTYEQRSGPADKG
jgi:hypothetical protein